MGGWFNFDGDEQITMRLAIEDNRFKPTNLKKGKSFHLFGKAVEETANCYVSFDLNKGIQLTLEETIQLKVCAGNNDISLQKERGRWLQRLQL